MRRGYDFVGVSCNAIILRNNKVLLVRRAEEPERGKWCFPGGRIELGETAEEAITREMKEELGIDFKPRFAFYNDSINPSLNSHYIELQFFGGIDGEIKLNGENSEFNWFSCVDALGLPIAFTHRKILEKLIAEKLL